MTKQQIQSAIKRNKQLLPLLVLMVYGIDTLITALLGTVVMGGETYDFSLNLKHYLGFAAIAINLIIYFLFRQLYKYSLPLTIAIGLFGLVAFSALQMKWNFGVIIGLPFGLQVAALLAGLVAYILNFHNVNQFLADHLTAKRTPQEEVIYKESKSAESIQKFKEKYDNYSTEKLNEIIAANKYVAEALEAARQLLNARHTK
jgi:hypothetical protein